MYEVFQDFLRFFKPKTVTIDNAIFRLHSTYTMSIFGVLSALVVQKQYFGDPIDCLVDQVPSDLMDTYCWIHSTFTVPSFTNATIGVEVPHPGIVNHYGMKEGPEVRYHKYYQWVTFALFFQCSLFYIPYYLWKTWEGGKMNMLAGGMNEALMDEEFKKTRIEMLVSYFTVNLRSHGPYAAKYIFCETLNFANVVGQIYFIDRFLGNEFTTYGRKVLEFMFSEIGTRHDPMDIIFPKVTKCTFHKYGTSGSIETHDGLCVLPLNILNEKIYVFLWFWLILVAVLTGIGIVYRLATLSRGMRSKIMATRCPLNDKIDVEIVNHKCKFGDWFMLYRLSKNMDAFAFRDFIVELASKFDGRHLAQ